MASFNGVDLGPACVMVTAPAPKELQINAYPGVVGIGVLDHGGRGGITQCNGWSVGVDAASLAAVEQAFRALQQSTGVYTLIDTLGTAWANVKLLEFEPEPRVFACVALGSGGWSRRYRMTFLHTS